MNGLKRNLIKGSKMNEELTLYYSVASGGDGSAYPIFFESDELAEWHQEHLSEGWGESCTGSITVKGSNLSCDDELETKEGYYLKLYFDRYGDDNEYVEFAKEFFPDGLPEFEVRCLENNKNCYGIYCGGKLVYKKFAYPEKEANPKKALELQKEIAEA